ncbi:MAG: 30S ribosome-binding factor RbfA [Ignavibacteriales bacterium]|nr:30S ribosome-binding factor RbfA [Ignavibacteriales bacterium]MCF8435971.1 30S ribosome-binding factor RbfA [Ignavibacteriales bacterium]
MASYRTQKVASLLKEELSLILLHKLSDPAFGLMTITSVKLSPDMKLAKIYVSTYQTEMREALLEKLNEVKGLIRSELAHRVQLRFVPELAFFIDDTLDYVDKMERIFKKLHDNEKKSDE